MKKKLSIIAVLILVTGLIAGVALPGVAAADEDEAPPQAGKMPPNMLRGKVLSVGESSFIIESGEGEEIPIAVDGDTKYFKVRTPQRIAALTEHRMTSEPVEAQERVGEGPVSLKSWIMGKIPWLKRERVGQAPPGTQAPPQLGMQAPPRLGMQAPPRLGMQAPPRLGMQAGNRGLATNLLNRGEGKGIPGQLPGRLGWLHRFGEKASFEDIAPDDKVVVRLSSSEDNSVAKLVLIIKPPACKRVNGTIGPVSDNSITITTTNGDTVTLRYDESTTFILKGITAVEPEQSAHAIYVCDGEDKLAKLVKVQPETAD